MLKKTSMILLVSALALGVGYDGYADNLLQGTKKSSRVGRLGKGLVITGLALSLSVNVFQFWSTQRITGKYEKLVGETRVLRDDFRNLASSLKTLDESDQVPDIVPEYGRGLAGGSAAYVDSVDGIPIRRSAISFDDRLTPGNNEAAVEGIDVEYIKELGTAGIAFHSVDTYNSKKGSLPANFYVGLTVFSRHEGVTRVGEVISIVAGDEPLLIIDHGEGGESLVSQSELKSVFVTRHPIYTNKEIDVEFPAASMESYNNKGLPQNYQLTYRRPNNRNDRLDIIREGSLQGKLIMPSTGDESVIKVVFPSGEEFFVLVPESDLTPF